MKKENKELAKKKKTAARKRQQAARGLKTAMWILIPCLVIAGIAMLFLPGQGLLTLVVGLMLVDFPGKRRRLVLADRRHRVPAAYLEAARQRGFEVEVSDDLATSLARLGADGALEVLVEAGPTLTGYMLASGLWDEHVRITRHGAADGTDHVEIRHIAA